MSVVNKSEKKVSSGEDLWEILNNTVEETKEEQTFIVAQDQKVEKVVEKEEEARPKNEVSQNEAQEGRGHAWTQQDIDSFNQAEAEAYDEMEQTQMFFLRSETFRQGGNRKDSEPPAPRQHRSGENTRVV